MRSISCIFLFSCAVLTGCGSSKADMTVGGSGDDVPKRHHSSVMANSEYLPSTPSYADGGASNGEGTSRGSGTLGMSTTGADGDSVDVTPHPAIPDTEVSYGKK
ncbi:hypothetical protein [Swingsia samuiensis]|uniref:Lipoprotein n=1 Tax=Swingsia samuiensis TaxID=1293412 RepID=A0A4Y6UHU5_9PROT|nr:hypothetical protein [Swingsia samuiensis]QDH17082.1 hypothetical protein E3D00_05510 [Swingsia samuiensis]